MTPPAWRLLGRELEGGWKVTREMRPSNAATGGNFSAGYIVEGANGERGFLKALDYSRAMRQGVDTPSELQRMTTSYLFERDLVLRCTARKFSRIVKGLAYGKVTVGPGLDGQVEYLIFELADGDIRRHIEVSKALADSWPFRVLHHVATGLFQLHQEATAHQDIKPSNVLTFGSNGSKIGDLGRASSLGAQPPHDDDAIAGDPAYAPPELLYRELSTDWKERRFGCDLYQLGSLAAFLLARANMTALILAELAANLHPRLWTGSFQEVLPHLYNGFYSALSKVAISIPEAVRSDAVFAISTLCEPDPKRRGHPKDLLLVPRRFSCERYIALFNLLTKRLELTAK